jgi:hypothetical protein
MRRAAITTALLLTGCHFTVSRSLAPGEIRGTVVFQGTGAATLPAGGAHVVLENSATSVDADDRGAFVLSGLPPGTYAITVTASQAGNGVADSGLRLRGITLASTTSGFGDSRDLGKITIGAFGGISGQVTVSGSAAPSAQAVLSAIAQTTADATGAFTFKDLPAGDYDLVALAPEADAPPLISASLTVHVNPRNTTAVPAIDLSAAMAASMGSLAGQARLTGQAVGNTSIDIALASPGVDPTSLPSVSTNDEAGDYSAVQIPAGIYSVTAEVGGYESVTVPFIVVGGQTSDVPPITLSPVTGGLPDGGTLPDSERIHAACENAGQCGDFTSPSATFPSESACEQDFGNALTGLEADSTCAATAEALKEMLDCVATTPCTAFQSNWPFCQAQFLALYEASGTDAGSACYSILNALFSQSPQPDGGTPTPDGGGSLTGWSIGHAEPFVRHDAAMVYDSALDSLMVLGGMAGPGGNDAPVQDGLVWEYTLGASQPAWQRTNPNGLAFPFDWNQSVIYDAANDRLVVFTSVSTLVGSTETNPVEVVTFDAQGNANWSAVTTTGGPPTLRLGATLVYDPADHQAYLFGGFDTQAQTALSEVWTLSLPATGSFTWTNVTPTGSPSPVAGRQFAAGAVNPGTGVLYVVGGQNAQGIPLTDSWAFTPGTGAGTWSSPTSSSLTSGTANSSAAYIPGATAAQDVLYYYGVPNGNTSTLELWELNVGAGASSSAWTSATQAGAAPSIRTGASFCQAPSVQGSDSFYVFGGEDQLQGIELNDLFVVTTSNQGADWNWNRLQQPHDEFVGASAIVEPSSGVYLWGGENGSQPTIDMPPYQNLLYESAPAFSSAWVPTSQPSLFPGSRTNAATVFDSRNSTMVLYGGDGGLLDTWRLNPTTLPPVFTLLSDGLTDSPGPSPTRSVVSSAYDSLNDQLIVFGGGVDMGSGLGPQPTWLNDTWAFSLGATPGWTQLNFGSQTLPGPRAGASAIYDTANNRMILIGGVGAAGTLSDVWSLALGSGNGSATWTMLQTSNADPTRPFLGIAQAAAAYDAANERVLLFGGGMGGIGPTVQQYSSELWSLQLGATTGVWTQLCPSGPIQPDARLGAILLATPGAFFLYGGTLDPGIFNGLDNVQYSLPLNNLPVCLQQGG